MLLLNENHLRYLLAFPASESNTLKTLFDALSRIEPLERDKLLGHAPSYLDADRTSDVEPEELAAEQRFEAFKRKCQSLVDGGFFDGAVTYSVVLLILNTLRHWGCPVSSADSERFLFGSFEHFQKVKAESADPDSYDHMLGMIEEARVNKRGDQELWRDRYERFCSDVLVQLLQPSGTGS